MDFEAERQWRQVYMALAGDVCHDPIRFPSLPRVTDELTPEAESDPQSDGSASYDADSAYAVPVDSPGGQWEALRQALRACEFVRDVYVHSPPYAVANDFFAGRRKVYQEPAYIFKAQQARIAPGSVIRALVSEWRCCHGQ